MNNQSSLSFHFIDKCIKIYNDLSHFYDGKMYSNKVDDIEIVITKRHDIPNKLISNMGNDEIDMFYSPDYKILINTETYRVVMYYPYTSIIKKDLYGSLLFECKIEELNDLGKLSEEECFYLELKYGYIFANQ